MPELHARFFVELLLRMTTGLHRSVSDREPPEGECQRCRVSSLIPTPLDTLKEKACIGRKHALGA
ncbi:MAG: hypothetical protein Kow0099_09470 [Candidatus Abyssubacteria bacterium]